MESPDLVLPSPGGNYFSPPSPEISKKKKVSNTAFPIIQSNTPPQSPSRGNRSLSLPAPTTSSTNQNKFTAKERFRLSMLFSSRSIEAVPFDQVSMNKYLYKNRRRLGTFYELARKCFHNQKSRFGLAHSLLYRFLEKRSFMETEHFLPCLRYTALMIANKYLEDCGVYNEDFLEMLPVLCLSVKRLRRMELAFLDAIDWDIGELNPIPYQVS